MRYLKPRDRGKRAHLVDSLDGPLCRNTSLPLDRYQLWEGDLLGDAICGNCKSVEFSLVPENFMLERTDGLCRCCGFKNVGGQKLNVGFYCMQCGEYWRFKVWLNPLPPLRESMTGQLPWE